MSRGGPLLDRLDWWVTTTDNSPAIRTGVYARLRQDVIDPKRTIIVLPNAWYRNQVIFSAQAGEAANLWSIPISARTWEAVGNPSRLTFGAAIEAGAQVSLNGNLVFAALNQS